MARKPRTTRPTTPSSHAKTGVYTVVAQVNGAWQAVAMPSDRKGGVEIARATPGARLYDPARALVRYTAEEAQQPVYPKPAPTVADATAVRLAPPESYKRPRLTDSINVRMTAQMRAQVEAVAKDGKRWPDGYAVDPSEVIREAVTRLLRIELSEPTD